MPTEDEIRHYYQSVLKERHGSDVVLVKTLLYTGVRVAELVAIRLDDVDLDTCRIRITQGNGNKDRVVLYSRLVHGDAGPCTWTPCASGASTSSSPAGRRPTAPGGAGHARPLRQARWLAHPISPHRLRHFFFTWLKTQGIDDALIQPYRGHVSRQSLEVSDPGISL